LYWVYIGWRREQQCKRKDGDDRVRMKKVEIRRTLSEVIAERGLKGEGERGNGGRRERKDYT
jgi:hypothetical protein